MRQYDEDYIQHLGKMQRPVPGMSLTNDPENPLPFEGPPEFVKKKDAIEYIFDRLIDEEVYPDVIEATANGAPIMETTQMILFSGFTQGKWNPDLLTLLAEPTAYMIMALSERAGVDYRIDREPEPDEVEEDEMKGVEGKYKKAKERLVKKDISASDIPADVKAKIDKVPLPSLVERPEKTEAPVEEEQPMPQETEALIPRRGQ